MNATRRRIVRRAVIAVAVVVMLLSGYVSTWFSMFWLMGRGTISARTSLNLQQNVFAPVVVYSRSDLPCSDWLVEGAQVAYASGKNFR